jgi:hypothetical protein
MKIKKNTFSTLVLELFFPSIAICRKLQLKNRLPLMWTLGVHFWCGVQPSRGEVFLSYWLNAANSGPTSWKCGAQVVRGPHRCPKISALYSTACTLYIEGNGRASLNNSLG